MFGIAIGDATGAPLEMLSPKVIEKKYGYVTEYVDGTRGKKGTFTDDTQMTIVLSESLIENKKFVPEDFAKKLMEFDESTWNCRFPGKTNTYACLGLRKGKQWYESGVDSEGCGSAMRVAPIGLVYNKNTNKIVEYAIKQGMITHNNPQANAASITVAYSVAYMLNNENLNKDQFIDDLLNVIKPVSIPFYNKIKEIKTNNYSFDKYLENSKCSEWVMETVPAALTAFLENPDDFYGQMFKLVNQGGDADSTGAIYGAISGAHNGIEKIAKRKDMITGLENKYKGKDYILQLSKGLIELNKDQYK